MDGTVSRAHDDVLAKVRHHVFPSDHHLTPLPLHRYEAAAARGRDNIPMGWHIVTDGNVDGRGIGATIAPCPLSRRTGGGNNVALALNISFWETPV